MTVLVTGATGHLGGLVVARLLAEARTVRILTRRPFLAARHFVDLGITVHEWHPSVEPVPAAALEGVTAVIHLMGAPLGGSTTPASLQQVRATRCGATQRLIAGFAAARRGAEGWRLIVPSVVPVSMVPVSMEVASAVPGSGPGEAEGPAEPAASDAPLTAAMLAAETQALAARNAGARVAVVRLGLLLVPAGPLATLARLASAGLRPDLEGRLIPAIDPGDAAAMLAGLVARPDIVGTLNGVAPTPLHGGDLMLVLGKIGPSRVQLPVPAWVLARRIGLLAPLLFNRAQIEPRRLLAMGAGFQHPDPKHSAARALATLRAEQTGLPAWWRGA